MKTCPHQSSQFRLRRLSYSVFRMLRKWRILNCCAVIISCVLLIRTLNKLPNQINSKPSINVVVDDKISPKRLPRKAPTAVPATEVEQNLIVEVQDFLVRPKTHIPKIIHQIYRNSSIPLVYKEFIESWMEKNPDYEYWFWDDASGRHFIQMFYPEFLELYDAYCHDLFRSDALRYFVLNEFGGIYIDMDYLCLKPIDDLLEERYLHVVQEHEPQAQLLYKTDDMILNAFMATVPYHPFMNFLINNLAPHAQCKFHNVLKSTGPLFVYKMIKRYYNVTKCSNDVCEINILPYEKMMPEWDVAKDSIRHKMRICRKMIKLTRAQRKACIFFRKNHFKVPAQLPASAIASHRFLHLGNEASKYRDKKGYVHISEIVPKVIYPMKKFDNEINVKNARVTDPKVLVFKPVS